MQARLEQDSLNPPPGGAGGGSLDLPFIRNRPLRWALLILLASLPLIGWWTTGLLDIDEGFYAAVTGSMIRHGEWTTPLYNGRPWFEKPILIYWAAKPSILLFGETLGPRLPSVLATIATYALVAWFGRRHYGKLGGVMSLFILASSLLTVAVGRMMMTDALLVLAFTFAMLAFWESLVGDRRWRHLTAAGLGVAVLAKGPVALVLFAIIAGLTYWRIPDLRSKFRGEWLLGTCILVLVISLWSVPAYLVNGQTFVQKFLIEQNIGRFTGGDAAHKVPLPAGLVFYVPILLVGMLPWIGWLPSAWPRKGAEDLDRYLFIWAAVIFGFFTLSTAKLMHYVLPCCPPVALLIGGHLSRRWQGLGRESMRPRLLLTLGWVLAIWAVAQVGFQEWYKRSGQQEAHLLARWIRSQGGQAALFQLPRRQKDLGTGKPELQETSLPSISFYLNQDVLQIEKVEDLITAPKPLWVFTRSTRFTTEELRKIVSAQQSLEPMRETEHFSVYRMAIRPSRS